MTRRSMVTSGQSVNDLPAWKVLMAGGVGGVMYWLLTYPTDVIKSSIQSDSTVPSEKKYSGKFFCVNQL